MKGGVTELVKEAGGGNVKEEEKRPYRTETGRIQGAGAGARKEDDLVEMGLRRFSLKDRYRNRNEKYIEESRIIFSLGRLLLVYENSRVHYNVHLHITKKK